MLEVHVHNCKSKALMKAFKELTIFCVYELMSKKLADQLTIKIQVCENVKDCDLGGCVGDCCWEDDPAVPREFTINVSLRDEKNKKSSRADLYGTIAHEIVHVKQWAKREKYWYQTKEKVRFKGKIYDLDKLDYWYHPWEIEAYGREKGLVQMWKKNQRIIRDAKLR